MSSSSAPAISGRFPPGAVLAGRYRVVSMLGKGGMGEVYRAEDLMLGQPVALKFLPESVAGNAPAVERFRNEVRVARQVSHPNVCRVYDIGEIEGKLFLSMEYIDGEDLGSLLRRIGRLPSDKALEISRKLCAGLAAAHQKGILHRDLKPANVMLDSRGRAVLTDFGLAALAGEVSGAEVRSGTPAYMSPEQLAGREVTVRSDIYSLGLVLYEIFTGKLPFESDTLAGLERARRETSPRNPSTLVGDIEPAVERVILRCLEPDPASRPASALAVAAALPGGDPLAAALAAGETPTPDMVVAAGEGTGLSPRAALALLGVFLAGVAACFAIGLRGSALERMRLPFSPEVLAQKARDVVAKAGYAQAPADEASGFTWAERYLSHVESVDKPPKWDEIMRQRPIPLRFWYRSSPAPMTADEFHDDLLTPGVVTMRDPTPVIAGMINVALDTGGRLFDFRAVPPEREEPPKQAPPPPDWGPLFAAAGIDPSTLERAEPEWAWLAAADARFAWTGKWPESGRRLRVEAASWRGKPVVFSLMGPWTAPERTAGGSEGVDVYLLILGVVAIVICTGAAWLARRNFAAGRGDRRGALRLAVFTGLLHMTLWTFRVHVTASAGLFGMFLLSLCTSVFYGVVAWTVYMALEPYVRRRWPRSIIGSTAALSGRWKDPIAGREVLVGAIFGMVWNLIPRACDIWLRARGAGLDLVSTDYILGIRPMLGGVLAILPHAVRDSLLFLFVLFLLRVLLRNQWAAAAGYAGFMAALGYFGSGPHPLFGLGIMFTIGALTAVLLVRFGLLALASAILTNSLLNHLPVTVNASSWYFGNAMFVLALLLAPAIWGFRTALGGRRLWKQDLLE